MRKPALTKKVILGIEDIVGHLTAGITLTEGDLANNTDVDSAMNFLVKLVQWHRDQQSLPPVAPEGLRGGVK